MRKHALLLLLSSLLLTHVCLADGTPATAKADTNQAQYETIKNNVLADCDNVDQALKEAAPTTDKIKTEIDAAHQSESDYIQARNAKATDATLDQLTSQYIAHLSELRLLDKDYHDQLAPLIQTLETDVQQLKPFADLVQADTVLMQRLTTIDDSVNAPLQSVDVLMQPVGHIAAEELADQKVDPSSLTEQQILDAFNHGARILLDAKAAESNLPEVTSDNFESLVKNSQIPVLVYFGVPSDEDCRKLVPELIEVAQRYQGKTTVLRVDLAHNPEFFNVMSVFNDTGLQAIPAVVLFVPDKDPITKQGAKECANLNALIDSVLPPAKSTK